MSLEPHEFRQTLGRFASGVTVVSVTHDGERRGMTANAFVSVSLSPPLVLVSVDRRAHMHSLLDKAERYGVSILAAGQRALSDHFAGKPDPGLEVAWLDLDGLPLLSGAVAHLICRKVEAYGAGDHTLYIGEVEYARYTDDDPLVYFRGQYHELA